tara:strand:+ start:210 stop:998 length:789 start_codon:yes stop_codon:yes gene_type:complete
MVSYDIIGSIAIMKFNGEKKAQKIKEAKKLLKRSNIKTVLEKSGKIKGRLRTLKTKYLAGDKTLETKHKENNCQMKLNIETCYFSPRLSEERKEVAEQINKKDQVLVMFSGVAPFPVIINKLARPKKIIAIELSKQCNKYAEENIKLNKLNNIELLQGDVKKVVKKGGLIVKGNLVPLQFDKIIMPRPNLKETFLREAFSVSKKNTIVFYYCFGKEKELNKNLEEINKEAKKAKKKIKILRVKRAGDIAPYKFRYRVDFRVN